jgi:YHS domain-containing protein
MSTRNAVLVSLLLFCGAAAAQQAPVYSTFLGGAIQGYDPVAYFTEGRAVEGSRQFSHQWSGATWRFASAANRDRFAQAPEKYAPQYGGYCAYGVAGGYAVKIDPQAWSVVDGKLYLNYSPAVQADWKKDVPGYIRKADTNWPKVLQ